MNDNDLAGGDAEQETGIQVDLGTDDPKKSVIRARATARPAKTPAKDTSYEDRMSKQMLKRIGKLESRFNQQLAEQQAEFQRQLAERDKRDTAVKPATETNEDAAHEAAIAKLQAELEEAQERGDSKAVAKITTEISRQEGRFWAQKAAKAGVQERKVEPAAAATPATASTNTGPTKASLAWAAKQDWWKDTTDDTAILARQMCGNLYATKLAEGADKNDPMLFEEIGEEIKRRFPELNVGSAIRRKKVADEDDPDEADGEDDTPARRAPPSMPNRGEPTRRQGLTHLTQADIRTMREVNLDPNNDKHVVQFLRSKNEIEAEA